MLPSVLIGGGGPNASTPVDNGPRQRLSRQRSRVDCVRWVAGGADRDTQRRRELVTLDARDQTVDDARRVLEIGVEQHDGERAALRVAQDVGVAHFAFDEL